MSQSIRQPRFPATAGVRVLVCIAALLAPTAVAAAQPGDPATVAAVSHQQRLAYWQQAAEKARDADNQDKLSQALRGQAQALQDLGHLDAALERLERAEAVSGRASTAERARTQNMRGVVLSAAGDLNQAHQAFERAVDLALEADQPVVAAKALNNSARLSAQQKDHELAISSFRAAARLAERHDRLELAATAYANAARSAVDLGRHETARTLLASAEAALTSPTEIGARATLHLNLGRIWQRLGRASGQDRELERARAHFQRARSPGQQADPYTESYALGYLGALAEDQARLDEALSYTTAAAFLAQEREAPEILYRWEWQTGRLLRRKGRIDPAIGAYRRAVAALESVRSELAASRSPGTSFRDEVGAVYFELADLLLVQAKQASTPQATAQRYRIEARDTIERLKAAELQDYFKDDCVTAVQSRIARLEELASRTAVIYPILLPDRMEILVAAGGELSQVTVDVPRDQIRAETQVFRRALQLYRGNEYRPYARQLYDWLMRPILPLLADQPIETLVFVPDDVLRTVPMAPLHDGSRFLIEEYAVVTTPGLTLTDPRPLQTREAKVLASGLTEPVQGFDALPAVKDEIRHIDRMYPSTTLLNESFREPKLKQELASHPFHIVHVATHGKIEPNVRQSFLLTYDGKLTMDDLERLVGFGRFSERPVELLTLSACETALGDERAALGLAGIALKAGARSAVATLWSISDAATARLVPDFYAALQEDPTSKADALRRAQLALLESKDFGHPGFWSPFLLIGNWL